MPYLDITAKWISYILAQSLRISAYNVLKSTKHTITLTFISLLLYPDFPKTFSVIQMLLLGFYLTLTANTLKSN